ncbi:MAG: LysM peptidoglycan-binding domain-containing protein [Ardenticatenaceae bacterium]|nr:LysM peptidoglycan-binding domain-containing protein [Ardenticatenaceae bacterium]
MRRLCILVLLPAVLLACRNGQAPVATDVPIENASEASSEPDSPRLDAEVLPTEAGLPPTWTPAPVDSGVMPSNSNTTTNAGTTAVQGTAVPSYAGSTVNYVVERGDTLAEICIAYNVAITEVARINNIADWDHIEVGQVLILPAEE